MDPLDQARAVEQALDPHIHIPREGTPFTYCGIPLKRAITWETWFGDEPAASAGYQECPACCALEAEADRREAERDLIDPDWPGSPEW